MTTSAIQTSITTMANLTTVGNITTGTWGADTIAVNMGGTGQTNYTLGQMLRGKSDGSLEKVTLAPGGATAITYASGTVTISSTDTNYTLSPASATVLGGVKVGSGLDITGGLMTTSVAVANKTITGSTINSTTIGATSRSSGKFTTVEVMSTDNSSIKTNGALVVLGGVGIALSLNVGEDITAYASSDRRLKTNIMAIENPLEKLKKINGYSFDWVETEGVHSNTGRDIGVIAQEIESVLPEITTTRDNGYKAVRYEKLTAFLIACVKEQQEQIENQRSQLDEQRIQLDAQQAQINALLAHCFG